MASVDAAAQMWSRTDLKPADLDLAELYDGFTYLTFAWLEALGICAEESPVRSSRERSGSPSTARCR